MRKNLIRYRQMTSMSVRGKNIKRVCKQKLIASVRKSRKGSWHNFKIALGMQARKVLLNKGLHRLAPITMPFGAHQRWKQTEISDPVSMDWTEWSPYSTSSAAPSGEAEGATEATSPGGVERGRGRGRGFRGGDRGSGRGRGEGGRGRGRGRGGPSRTHSVIRFFTYVGTPH